MRPRSWWWRRPSIAPRRPSLNALRVHGARVAVGLHLTLSAPFQPLTQGFTPLVDEAFPTYRMMLVRAWLRQLDRKALEAEVAAQIRMFGHEFGRAPDFIDGHQHVHIFPQVRDALFAVARKMAPIAWIRQCGRAGTLAADGSAIRRGSCSTT